ncbi:C2 domain protein, partial [Opisthorchis viverrini]
MFLEKAEQIASRQFKDFRKKHKKFDHGIDDSYPSSTKHKTRKNKHTGLFNRLRGRSTNGEGSSTSSSPTSTLDQRSMPRWNSACGIGVIPDGRAGSSDPGTRSNTLTNHSRCRSASSSPVHSINESEDELSTSITSNDTVVKQEMMRIQRAGSVGDGQTSIRDGSSDRSQSRDSTATFSFRSETIDDTASTRITDRIQSDIPTLDYEIARVKIPKMPNSTQSSPVELPRRNAITSVDTPDRLIRRRSSSVDGDRTPHMDVSSPSFGACLMVDSLNKIAEQRCMSLRALDGDDSDTAVEEEQDKTSSSGKKVKKPLIKWTAKSLRKPKDSPKTISSKETQEDSLQASEVSAGHDSDLDPQSPRSSMTSEDISELLPRDGYLWSLRLYLKCARNLLVKGIQGKSDSYVKVKYRGKRIRRTKTVFNDRNPVYDQTVFFIVNNLGCPIELRVYNQDVFKKDEYVGRVLMPLKNLVLNQLQEFSVQLTNEDSNEATPVGELTFSLILGEKPELEVAADRRQFLLKQLKIDRQNAYQYPTMTTKRPSPDISPTGCDVSSWCENAARFYSDSAQEMNSIYAQNIYSAIDDDEMEEDDWLDENEFYFRQPSWPACFYDGTKLEVYTGRLPNKLQPLPFSQISRLPKVITDVNWEQMYTRSKLVVSLIGAQRLEPKQKSETIFPGSVHRSHSQRARSSKKHASGHEEKSKSDVVEPPSPMALLSVGRTTFRSAVIKNTRHPSWHQEFEFRLRTGDKKILQVEIRDMSTNPYTTLVRAYLDFAKLMPDWTDCFTLKNVIEGHEGQVVLLATLTGFSKPLDPSSVSPLPPNYRTSQVSVRSPEPVEDGVIVPPTQTPVPSELLELVAENYSLRNTIKDRFDVGWLHVFANPFLLSNTHKNMFVYPVYRVDPFLYGVFAVIGARQIKAADSNGKSDPYCTLRLVNRVAYTSTIYKTLDPTWNQGFVFPIGDIYSVLEVTIWDEDKEKADFLGRIQLPLNQITSRRKRWYTLKDKTMKKLAKGSICLEVNVEHNPIRAAIRAAYPREEPCVWQENRVKLRNLQGHITRITSYTPPIEVGTQALKKLYTWENPTYSALFIVAMCLTILYIQPYMIAFGITIGLILVRLSHIRWFNSANKSKRPCAPVIDNDD